MRFKKNTILLILYIFSVTSLKIYAQTSKEIKLEKRKVRQERKDSIQKLPVNNYITFDLTTLLPTDFPRINMGYIYEISDRIDIGGDIGIGINGHASKEDYFLWEVRPKLIYNIAKRHRFQHFISLETFLISNKETRFNGEFEPKNDQGGTVESIRFDRVDYSRIKYGVTLNYGELINFSKRLGMQTIIGAGIRFKDNTYENIVNPIPLPEFSDKGFFFESPFRKEGTVAGFEFNIRIKLIYKLQ